MLNNRVVAAGCVLAGSLTLGQASAASRDIQRYGQGGWVVTIGHDRFTAVTRCDLRARDGRMLYQPGAVGFRMRSRDTLHAWYRIDGGTPVRWQDHYPSLIATGAKIDGPGLDNPTDRIVWIPLAELASARTVAIRTRDHGTPHVFALGGMSAMLDAAHRLGCADDTPLAA